MENKNSNSLKSLNFSEDINVNNPDFYTNVQSETESDIAKMKKYVEVVTNLRGAHEDGEQLAYASHNVIPPFTPIYHLNVSHQKHTNLASRYTYVRIELMNAVSKIITNYSPDDYVMTVYIKLPFEPTEYSIVGYALPNELEDARSQSQNNETTNSTIREFEGKYLHNKTYLLNNYTYLRAECRNTNALKGQIVMKYDPNTTVLVVNTVVVQFKTSACQNNTQLSVVGYAIPFPLIQKPIKRHRPVSSEILKYSLELIAI